MPDIFIKEKTESVSKDNNTSIENKSPEKIDLVYKPRHSFWQKLKQPLAAYLTNPVGMRFESQEDQEEIILLLRQHPITNLPWIAGAVLMLFAPGVIFPLLAFLNPFPDLPLSYHFVFTLFWYCLTFSVVFINYLHWFFNVYLVTNERVVDVDFHNLVYRQLSSTRVSKIQDVTYKVNGVIRSLIDYGDVFIQTAGTEENFDFEAVPQPQLVVKKISELVEKKEENQPNSTGV